MKEFVARENIKRFEGRLAACTDPAQREILSRLLDAEQQRLKDARAEKLGLPDNSGRSSS